MSGSSDVSGSEATLHGGYGRGVGPGLEPGSNTKKVRLQGLDGHGYGVWQSMDQKTGIRPRTKFLKRVISSQRTVASAARRPSGWPNGGTLRRLISLEPNGLPSGPGLWSSPRSISPVVARP
jgi:hypothetical protein